MVDPIYVISLEVCFSEQACSSLYKDVGGAATLSVATCLYEPLNGYITCTANKQCIRPLTFNSRESRCESSPLDSSICLVELYFANSMLQCLCLPRNSAELQQDIVRLPISSTSHENPAAFPYSISCCLVKNRSQRLFFSSLSFFRD